MRERMEDMKNPSGRPAARRLSMVLVFAGAALLGGGVLFSLPEEPKLPSEESPRGKSGESSPEVAPESSSKTPRERAPQPDAGANFLRQSPGATAESLESFDFGLGEHHVSKLPPYPPGEKGDRTPLDLWRFAGRGRSSFGSPILNVPFKEWVERHRK